MAVKTDRVDSSDGAAELAELNEIRLSRNWSWPQLSDDMRRTGHEVSHKTLHALISTPGKVPYDRTLYQIRKYLAVVREETAAAGKRVPA